MQAIKSELQPNGKQLLQMLSTTRKKMEDQQTEMTRLCEATAREKEAVTRVRTLLLKQFGTWQKSQPYYRRKCADSLVTIAYSGIHTLHWKLKARPVGDL